MNRRRFLIRSATALGAASLAAACRDDVTPATLTVAPPPPIASQFPALTFITCDPAFTDYRPAIDATGTIVLFERTPFPNPNDVPTAIYMVKAGATCASATATAFVPPPVNAPATFPFAQTRPDWSWVTGQVAFSGAPSNSANNQIQIYTVGSTGGAPTLVPQTIQHIYPIWTSDGKMLVAYNENPTNAFPLPPVSALIDPMTGDRYVKNLNGNDADNVPVFGGFAAPQPGNPRHIAFAGQPELASWGMPASPTTTGTAPVYNQDNNYVFLNSVSNAVYSSAPLEPGASISAYDSTKQGRAPYWSPNGQYIVFETSRYGGYALCLANVAALAKGAAPVQLTDAGYAAQHAKFLPNGHQLVFTALQTPNAAGTGPRGIALIDISPYL